ncbi:IclR family transcriptional regulator [Caballeronia cordobensis]|uniref:IclR family transcriptional regulator n=1 Tax=Caballeronia cordobensis TaxID=1353886 RepID=A0A158GMY5_CABCO|nr:IclR family transcriptional regulator [Caballeronia cordobensis]SAL33217.1 IclR family transcriptional regulator [Caballeronia cordobensis]
MSRDASHMDPPTGDYADSKVRYEPDEFEGDRQFATTLARGLDILQCFTPREPQLGNAELAARTGMTKATISRFTYTLTRLGYLRVNRLNNKFQLGSAVLSLGYPLLASLTVRQIARPSMRELADQVRGSVSLGMRDRLNVVYLESSRSATPLGLPADIGLSYPIVRTAMGRALLAAMPLERREAVCNEISVKTPGDWTTFRERVMASIESFHQRGFCASYGDLRREVHAVAVPMKPSADGEILVFNCGVPSYLLKEGQLEGDIGPRLVSMVRALEGAMGIY